MNRLAILLGKLIIAISRLVGNQGSALPGLVVEKLAPRFLPTMLGQLPEGVIVVTGTNGKTSTTKAVTHLLSGSGLRVLSNPTGSNLTRGVVSMILDKSSWGGKLDFDIAALELDEAFSRKFVKSVPPKYVLLLNVMRDQLDRYGEIDSTANMLTEAARAATHGVVLNQDDNRVTSIAKKLNISNVKFFGASPNLSHLLPNDDEMFSGAVGRPGNEHVNLVELLSYEERRAIFSVGDNLVNASLNMAGVHNAMNMTAALALIKCINPGADMTILAKELETLEPAWGRGEVAEVGDTVITLALVKNPAGFRQSMRSYENEKADSIMFAINDKFADGRDVSWLWDVDFTTINNDTSLYVSGIRAYDMALRLEYDDKVVKNVNTSELQILQQILEQKPANVIIFCTYTAMTSIRKQLAKVSNIEAATW